MKVKSILQLILISGVICGSLATTTAVAESGTTTDSGLETTQDNANQTTQQAGVTTQVTTHVHGNMTTEGSNGSTTLMLTLPSIFIVLLTVLYNNLR